MIAANRIIGNLHHAIVNGDSGNSIIDNVVLGNMGDGLQLVSPDNDSVNNTVLRNEIHANDGNGIMNLFGEGNEIRDNDAADNALVPVRSGIYTYFLPGIEAGDLLSFDFASLDEYFNTGEWVPENVDCGTNVWFNNTWGSGGYFPACVTAGGSGPVTVPAAASRSSGATRTDLAPSEPEQLLPPSRPPLPSN